VLRCDAKPCATRHHDLHARRALEQIVDRARRVKQLLKVVQHEEHALAGEMFVNRRLERPVARLEQPECLRDRREQQCRFVDRLERDEPHAVREQLDSFRRGVKREAGLARTPRPRERHEAYVVISEQRLERAELGCAADKRRRLRGQVRGSIFECPQRRELRLQARCEELVESLRPRQILEAMLSEVARLDIGEIARRLREHDLTTARRGANASRPVHVEADVTTADDRRLSGMDAHADMHRKSVESALPSGGSKNGVAGAIEGVEQRIALRVDLVSRSEGLAQPLTVLLEGLSKRDHTELGEQARGLLDVSKEKCDGTARQLGHA
jgi:hypothetical protein